MDEYTLGIFKKAVDAPHGMILVTGPTGSGKTTTLYSVLSELNNPEYNIVTVEDPIEYQLAGINQVAVKADIGLSFADALRSILRQDPDIVMIGEIRDNETADIAVKAALTGHQVLSTLHTNDAAGAITRLDDMGIEPFLISSSVHPHLRPASRAPRLPELPRGLRARAGAAAKARDRRTTAAPSSTTAPAANAANAAATWAARRSSKCCP